MVGCVRMNPEDVVWDGLKQLADFSGTLRKKFLLYSLPWSCTSYFASFKTDIEFRPFPKQGCWRACAFHPAADRFFAVLGLESPS